MPCTRSATGTSPIVYVRDADTVAPPAGTFNSVSPRNSVAPAFESTCNRAFRYLCRVDTEQIRSAFETAFDQALVFHSFTEYMRDYELVIQMSTGAGPEAPTTFARYIFTNCVEVSVTTSVSPKIWAQSLDERLIQYQTGADLDGYVWGVNWQELYPGLELVTESARTDAWSEQLGVPFHEARIGAGAHNFTLIFSDLRIEPAEMGYVPFAVGAGFWDGKLPL